ncbi:hypothetical protein PIROE2DRAFT_4939 [Piromyces sp. E2]|nr:hypothetical protein PIROE2DRAFT_4939 [Piromyces sp. E2]|eukprot:OUM67536.1 hypothetical protein PIROE2DRAFT_4939 [Piromyces sp. E2]
MFTVDKIHPLIINFYQSKLDILKMIIQNNSKMNQNAHNLFKILALNIACNVKDYEFIQYLLNNFSDQIFWQKYSCFLIKKIVKRPHIHIINYFIQNRKDSILLKKLNQTSIALESDIYYINCIKYLIEHVVLTNDFVKYYSIKQKPFILIDKTIGYDLFIYLIKKGENINIETEFGSSLLMRECEQGHFMKVKYLINQGVNINHQNHYDDTPLSYACEQGNIDIVQYLVDHGTLINIRNRYGDTALHAAHEHEHINIVNYIINKLNINNMNNSYYQSFLLKIKKKKKYIIRLFKKKL